MSPEIKPGYNYVLSDSEHDGAGVRGVMFKVPNPPSRSRVAAVSRDDLITAVKRHSANSTRQIQALGLGEK